jgi:SAM-dependent methyltransferase
MNRTPDFDRLAGIYRWLEIATFGTALWQCRCAFLGQVRHASHALVIGDGDGRFAARLLRENPFIQIDAVDASPAMLRALVHRAGLDASRVRIFAADARGWLPPQAPPYDLVVTHFFLDCLTIAEVLSLASTLRPVLSPQAVWVISEFAIPSGAFGALIARPLVAALYRIFGLLTGLAIRQLPDHRTALEQAGFSCRRSRTWLGGLLVGEIWSVS